MLVSLRVGESNNPFSDAARNLRVIFDSQLALQEQVNKLCQLAHLEIRAGQVSLTVSFF